MNCCICGPAKNCGSFLQIVLENMVKIGLLFDDYKILIYYDTSVDNTLNILKTFQKTNSRLIFYINKQLATPFRTHNLAIARNFCLKYVKDNKKDYPFFIMMDLDDVNCKTLNTHALKDALKRETDWDGLSFNSTPLYYDIWGLSIYPYCFSYNHFEDNIMNYTKIQTYINNLLKEHKKTNTYQSCISSFNGFSIYKTKKFLNTYYDGRIRLDLISSNNLTAHMNATNSKLIYKKYITVDGRYEDCEHRAFHIQAIKNDNARIMISPNVLFY
jgi:hypothetical protein